MSSWIRWSCALALAWASAPSLGADSLEEWLARFSRERARAGALPLRPSPVLTQVAQQQAEEMARAGRHLRSPSAKAVSGWLRQVGYSAHDWREYFSLSDAVPEALSATLRGAADGRFRDLGIGTAVAGGLTFRVYLFGWHQGDYFAAATARLGDRSRIADEMLSRVNEIRRREGVPPLAANPLLDRIAQEHAEDMLLRSYSGHRTPEGLGPSDRARAEGYRTGIGENIVEQRFSVEEALEAWLASPGHRRNLLDPDCRELGLGLAVGAGYDAAPGGYRVIWVQSFGRGE
ncbi:MAG TPA: CAP domain-containing protein [Thermoanaerobaculia bacterium]|nr:CAP domain-containing protein [Thermoanaerobaculia bacterium]